jgi:hypothetical protein
MVMVIFMKNLRRKNYMKKWIIACLLVILIAGVAYGKPYEVKKAAGSYAVVVSMDKNPPALGVNGMQISIRDANHQVVNDAKVVVNYDMAAMPGMAPMSYKASAVLDGDVYKAAIKITMGGPWQVTIKIARNGETASMKFTFDVN